MAKKGVLEKVYDKGQLVAIILKSFPKSFKNGAISFTEEYLPLQLLAHRNKKGDKIDLHFHKAKKRIINQLNECLILQKGRIRLRLFDKRGALLKSLLLRTGDIFLLISGGHSIEFLDDADMVEIKNGPFLDDKVFLD